MKTPTLLIEPMLLYVHTVSMLDGKDISIIHQGNTVAGAGFRVPFTCGLSCCIHTYRGLGHVKDTITCFNALPA